MSLIRIGKLYRLNKDVLFEFKTATGVRSTYLLKDTILMYVGRRQRGRALATIYPTGTNSTFSPLYGDTASTSREILLPIYEHSFLHGERVYWLRRVEGTFDCLEEAKEK